MSRMVGDSYRHRLRSFVIAAAHTGSGEDTLRNAVYTYVQAYPECKFSIQWRHREDLWRFGNIRILAVNDGTRIC